MKLMFLVLCIGLLSVAVFARDLSSIARKERLRRQSIHAPARESKKYTNDDLEGYAEHGESERGQIRLETNGPARNAYRDRDLKAEAAHWRKEKLRHDRELARLDANIRRIEWRLRERQTKSRADNRARDEPAVSLMKESLESMREEREELESDFRDRARKAGAFPGWLR